MRGLLKHPEFRIGVAQAMPLMPGMAAWGVMTGVAMIKSGLSLWEAVLMGTLVFAGSSQLAGLPLILGGVLIVAGSVVVVRGERTATHAATATHGLSID